MINERLKSFLAQPGWTQRRLAEAVGVREATVSGWANGTRPRPEQMDKIAKATANAVPVMSWFESDEAAA